MGADLFESYTGSIISPTILAITMASLGYFMGVDILWSILVPVMIAACGIITSVIGLTAVRTSENADSAALSKALNRGTYLAAIIEIVAIFVIFFAWQNQTAAGNQPLWLFGSVVCGLVAGLAIGKVTEYYTSDSYKPVKKIAEDSETGAATSAIFLTGL